MGAEAIHRTGGRWLRRCVSLCRRRELLRPDAAALGAGGVISSEYIFRAGLDYSGKAPQLKHGSYLIEPATPMEKVIDQLTTSGASSCGGGGDLPDWRARNGCCAA